MNKEEFVISRFFNKYIGDDGAVIGDFVYSKDLFVENSHFKKGWLTFFEIGKKAMLVNVSDAIVMNARPKFALLGLGFSKNTTFAQINELKNGIMSVCKQYDIKIIGGDTISSSFLSLSVTLVSSVKKPVFRKRLKDGDLIAYTGKIGGSLKALRVLQNGGTVGKNSRFKNIILRDKFFYNSAKFLRSAMDISDGLCSDLPKFVGNKNLKFIKKLNYFEFNSGEEYEILLSCTKKHKQRLINEAKKARVPLTFFAKVTKGKYKTYGKNEHF